MMKQMDPETLQRLEEEGKERGLSSSFLAFIQRLFRIHSEVEYRVAPVEYSLDKKGANGRSEYGLPLISRDELTLDWELLKRESC